MWVERCPILSNSAIPAECPIHLMHPWHYLPGNSIRSHGLRAQSPKTAPASEAGPMWWDPREPTLLSDLATRPWFPRPPPGVRPFAAAAPGTWGNALRLLPRLSSRIQMHGQTKRYLGRGLGGSRAQALLFPWPLGQTTFLVHDLPPRSSLNPFF